MKILTPTTEVWGECPTGVDEAVLWIERCGRICYRSEDKIIEGSGRKFVDGIVRRKHFSVIEHSNLVIRSNKKYKFPSDTLAAIRGSYDSKFLHFLVHDDHVYIGGNFRAWMEALHIPTIDDLFAHPLRTGFTIVDAHEDIPVPLRVITAKFLTDRAVTHELVRHRPMSVSQESQRFCSYKKHLEVILPDHYTDVPHTKDSDAMRRYQAWSQSMEHSEQVYRKLLEEGEKAEQARSVLPNSTATRIVCTASVPEWNHIFYLRTSAAAYPAIRSIINPVKQRFQEERYVRYCPNCDKESKCIH